MKQKVKIAPEPTKAVIEVDYNCKGLLDTLNLNIMQWRKRKGFKTDWGNVPEKLLLTVSEISECFEAYRDFPLEFIRRQKKNPNKVKVDEDPELMKRLANFKEEIADTYIRLGDLCASLRIGIETWIETKMRRNETRPKRHGRCR